MKACCGRDSPEAPTLQHRLDCCVYIQWYGQSWSEDLFPGPVMNAVHVQAAGSVNDVNAGCNHCCLMCRIMCKLCL